MTIRIAALIATAASLALAAPAHAAEIKVLSSNAVKTVLEDLGPKFEKASGNKIVFTWGTAATLKTEIEKGAAVDVAVLTDGAVDDLIKKGKLASRTALASASIAVAIKKGAAKPDLSSTEAFKKMLLSAKSIAWVETGASGIYLKGCSRNLALPTRSRAS